MFGFTGINELLILMLVIGVLSMTGLWPRIMQGLPWKSAGATPAYARAPSPGEHNDYMFGQLLGFPEDQIERLKESKVIY